jgi:DNA-binding NarL/FixJ family response regulator
MTTRSSVAACALLEAVDTVEVVGEAATGVEAVDATRDLQPDVVVMDVHMPELDGVAATRQIVHDSPHVAVLVLTMFDDGSVFAAMRAGAVGYLLKGARVPACLMPPASAPSSPPVVSAAR